jgi:multiple sugar transport system permease protein
VTTQTIAGTGTVRQEAAAVRQRARREDRTALGFLAPFVVLYLLFVIGPTVYAILLSLFNGSLVKPGLGSFAGLGNYAEALGSADFWSSLWHTIYFTILTTPPLVILAFIFALLADRARRGRWFFRFAFFVPYVLPSAVMALIWTWIYTPAIGLANSWLGAIGITAPQWLGDPHWAMPSVAIATVWWTLGFNFILYLAGLQDIPRELYEAASLDGAGPFQQIFRITIPLLARTTTLVIVLQVIASLKIFDQIYLMTSGGPNFSTRPSLEYIYDQSFTNMRIGYGSAVSMLLFLVILAVSFVWFRISNAQQEGGV